MIRAVLRPGAPLLMLIVTGMSGCTTLTSEAVGPSAMTLLARPNWHELDVASTLPLLAAVPEHLDISAGLVGPDDQCGPTRVVRDLHHVRNGICLACIELEFLKEGSSGRFALGSLRISEQYGSLTQVRKRVHELLQAAGVPDGVIATIGLPSAVGTPWTATWVKDGEARSIELQVTDAEDGAWFLYVDELRQEVPGSPDTPISWW